MQDDQLKREKDNAYWERNQLVAALSKMFPSHLAKHPEEDKDWEEDWRTIVVVYLNADDDVNKNFRVSERTVTKIMGSPYYQLTWHIHDSEIPLFDHLTYQTILNDEQVNIQNQVTSYDWQNTKFIWDGHTTEEKYRRLRSLNDGYLVTRLAGVKQSISEAEAKGKASGERTVRSIANTELQGAGLSSYENAEIIPPELQGSIGYPTKPSARKITEKIFKLIMQHHLSKIENTHEVEENRDTMGMASSGYDKRITRE